MAQFARPISDGLQQWTPTPSGTHYTTVDEETTDDNDYISATSAGLTDSFGLSEVQDPQVDTDHRIFWRARSTGGSGQGEKMVVYLYEGGTAVGDSGTVTVNRDTFALDWFDLSTSEAASITDYSNLSLRFVSTSVGSGEEIQISQAYFTVLDAPVFIREQSKGSTFDNVSQSQLAFDNSVKAGSALICLMDVFCNTTPACSIADNQSNSWSEIYEVQYKDSNHRGYLAYALNAAAGATTITVTHNSGTYTAMVIVEVSGIATSGALDVYNAAESTGTAWDSGNITTNDPDEYLIGMICQDEGSFTLTEDLLFDLIYENEDYTHMPINVGERILGSTATESYSGTISSSTTWWAAIAAFSATGGGGDVTFAADMVGASSTPSASWGIERSMAASAIGSCATAAIPLSISRPFAAELVGASATSAPVLGKLISMAAELVGSSSTPAVAMAIERAMAAVAIGGSATSTPAWAIDRVLSAAAVGASTTPNISMAVERGMAAVAVGVSQTSTPALQKAISFAADLVGASATLAAALNIDRPFAATAIGQSATSTPTWEIVRGMAAEMIGASAVSAPHLSIGGEVTFSGLMEALTVTLSAQLGIERGMAAQLVGASLAASAALAVERGMAANLVGASASSAPGLSIDRPFAATLTGSSAASVPAWLIERSMAATLTGSSTTSVPTWVIERSLAAIMTAVSAVSAPHLTVGGQVTFSAILAGLSTTPTAGLLIDRPFAAEALGASGTAAVALGIIRGFLAEAVGVSLTSTPSWEIVRAMTADMAGSSSTSIPSWLIDRVMTGEIDIVTATSLVTLSKFLAQGLVTVDLAALVPAIIFLAGLPAIKSKGASPDIVTSSSAPAIVFTGESQ